MKKEVLENLEKKFIKDVDAEIENIERFISRISEFAGVDKNGHIILMDNSLKGRLRDSDKILLVLTARFLANKLQERLGRDVTISPNVNAEEISKYFDIKKDTTTARLNDLKKERKIILRERGTFSIAPYYIETVLKKLDSIKEKNHTYK